MALTTAKTITLVLDNYLETYEHQDSLTNQISTYQASPADLQNSNDVIVRRVQQHAPIIKGLDITGQETGIIDQNYSTQLIKDDITNDFVKLDITEVRDERYWIDRAKQSAKQQVTEKNNAIANAIATDGSLYYRHDLSVPANNNGFTFISRAQTLLNEREGYHSTRCFMLNDRDSEKFANELSGRQTLAGRPESDAWKLGQIGEGVAEFNLFKVPFLPIQTGGVNPATTVVGNQSFKPEGSTTIGKSPVNIDYRSAIVSVANSSLYNVGDKVTFPGVFALTEASKVDTQQLMQFTIPSIPDGTSIEIYPKPIAINDPALTILEKASAIVTNRILNGVTVDRVNIDDQRTNLFFDKEAIEIVTGDLPVELYSEFAGQTVISERLSDGQSVYIIYDATIGDLSVTMRILMWYRIEIADPKRCGVAVTFN